MIPNVQIKFTVDDNPKTLDYRQVNFTAWEELQALHSLTPQTFVSAVGDGDVRAVLSLLWLERKQRERRLKYSDVRADVIDKSYDIDVVDIVVDGKSFLGEDVEVEEEDPTGGGS